MMSVTFEPLRRSDILRGIKFCIQPPMAFRCLNLDRRMEDLTSWPVSAIILSFCDHLNVRKICNQVCFIQLTFQQLCCHRCIKSKARPSNSVS